MLDKLCSYGCNKKAIIKFKNDKYCCSLKTSKCPMEKSKASKTATKRWSDKNERNKQSDKTKKRFLDKK